MTARRIKDRATARWSATSGTCRRASALNGLATLLLTGGLLVGTAVPAAAHDQLVSSSPEGGSTVGVVPEEISLTFSGDLITDSSAVIIEVVAPDGQNIASGDPVINGVTVTQPVLPVQVGVFTVRWRVVSSDGHPISGEYSYTVESMTIATSTPTPVATSERTPIPAPTSTESTSNPGHGEPSGGGALLPVLAVASGVMVLGAVLVVVLMVAGERRRRDKTAAAGEGAADES